MIPMSFIDVYVVVLCRFSFIYMYVLYIARSLCDLSFYSYASMKNSLVLVERGKLNGIITKDYFALGKMFLLRVFMIELDESMFL